MTYAEAIDYLNGLARFGWRLGLDRMEALCDRLGHPERAYDSVHVTGTNGKGSTATFLAAILQAAGYRTGLFTSPHLYDGRERVRVNGEMIDEEEVCDLIETLIPHITKVQQQHGAITEFEAWTAAMFLDFERHSVRTAVLEAGLGGRWDATNVVWPRLAILTNVSLDHTDRLGATVAEIGRDKAGIIKANSKALVGTLPADVRHEVETEARLVRSRLYTLASRNDNPPHGDPSTRFSWELIGPSTLTLIRPDHTQMDLPFSGPRYQGRNAALAAAAACILSTEDGYEIPDHAIESGLKTTIPGRFQVVLREPEVILDAAHNPSAAAVLAAELARGRVTPVSQPTTSPPLYPDLRMVFGASSGHDAEGCLRILGPLCREVILTHAKTPRARDPEELGRILADLSIPFEIIPDVAKAVGTAVQRSRPVDRVCVTGSFFVLGEVPRPVLPPFAPELGDPPPQQASGK